MSEKYHMFRTQYREAGLSEDMTGRRDRRVYVPVSKGSNEWVAIDEVQFGFPDVHDHTGYKTVVSQSVCKPSKYQPAIGMDPNFVNTTYGVIYKTTNNTQPIIQQNGGGHLNQFSHPNGLGVKFGKLPNHPRWAPEEPIEMGLAGHGLDKVGHF